MIIPRSQPQPDGSEPAQTVSTLVQRLSAEAPAGASSPVPKKKEPKVRGPESSNWLLTRKQKLHLVRLAHTAWVRSGAAKADETEEAFRQRESLATCGHRISEATQRDFNALAATFKRLAGDMDGAFDAAMKVENSDHNVAKFKLMAELKRHELPEQYGLAILKHKYKVTGWSWATAKQIWGVLFDVRRSHTEKAKVRRTYQDDMKKLLAEQAEINARPQDYDEPF